METGPAPLRIAFDVGGVLTKYPEVFRPLVNALAASGAVEVHILTDMPDRDRTVALLRQNGFGAVPEANVHRADYAAHGERCKAVLLQALKIDVFIDDHPGYLTEGCPVRLQVWPDPGRPYYSPEWQGS